MTRASRKMYFRHLSDQFIHSYRLVRADLKKKEGNMNRKCHNHHARIQKVLSQWVQSRIQILYHNKRAIIGPLAKRHSMHLPLQSRIKAFCGIMPCWTPDFVVYEQQRRISACASAQSDQHLCYTCMLSYYSCTCSYETT